jgi:CBS domain-containing protein
MNEVRARDIMSTDLTVVAPKTPVDRMAALMALKMISALPVVDAEFHILGIVSEGDLVARREAATLPRQSWWLRLFADTDSLAREYTKTHGLTAEDVMVRHVVSVGPDTPAAQIADIMRRKGIKRVPVTENGKLVGIVSRADIVQMVALRNADLQDGPHSDTEIQHEVLERLANEPWAAVQHLSISVQKGLVEVSGLVNSADQKHAMGVLIRDVPGVLDVRDLTRILPIQGL